MCWICSLNRYPEGIIAKQDFKVYKILKNDGESMFYNHKYNISELQPFININVKIVLGGYVINEGYHSYSDIRTANRIAKRYKMSPTFKSTIIVAEFKIPKETKFYINELGEVVSEQIIRVK